MVRGKTRPDESELARLGIVHGEMTVRLLEREELRRGMIRSLLAESGIVRRTHPRGEPHPPLLVEHRVVHAGLAVPDGLVSPVGRRGSRVFLRRRRVWIAHGHPDLCPGMPQG